MISHRRRKDMSAAYKNTRVRGDGRSATPRPCISKKMLDASQFEIPVSPVREFRSLLATGTESPPSITSRLRSCPEVTALGANTHLTAVGGHVRPIDDRLFVPDHPGTFAGFLKQFSDHKVLIVNRSLGVNRNEFEDYCQRFILADDAADKLAIAFEGVADVGDILSGLVILGFAGGRYTLSARHRRDREIEHNARPVEGRINM